MNHCDGQLLTQYEPIVEAIVTFSWDPAGWDLKVNHRHWAGRFGACGQETYESLSPGELVDVLAALLWTWGPQGEQRAPERL